MSLTRSLTVHRFLAGLLAAIALAVAAPAARGQTIIYVKAGAPAGGNGQSWQTAYQDLQMALSAAAAIPETLRDVEIWVSAGTYRPSVRRVPAEPRTETFVMLRKVALYGGFAGTETTRESRDVRSNVTTLSGDIDLNDNPDGSNNTGNAANILWMWYTDLTTVIDGFLIRGGYAINTSEVTGGGAVVVFGSAVFRNCTFLQNAASYGGAAIRFNYADAHVIGCRFLGNSVGDVGGAVLSQNSGVGYFTNCEFSGNSARFGGGLYWASGFVGVYSCSFVNNLAETGGNVLVADCAAHFRGTLLWTSTAYGGNGPVGWRSNADVLVYHCSTFGGGGNPSGFGGSGTLDWVNTNGDGGAFPNFIDADGPDNIPGTLDDDLRLGLGSPCIDGAMNDIVSAALPPGSMVQDLAGNRRVFDGNGDGTATLDIGAYEFGSPIYSPVLYVQAEAVGANDGSSWSNAFSGPQGLARALTLSSTAVPDGAFSQIWVASGTYTPAPPGGSRSASFQLQNNLAIYGGFAGTETTLAQRNIAANPTILSGDVNGDDNGDLNRNDNSYAVVFANQCDSTCVLDGVTVSAGYNATGGTIAWGAARIVGGSPRLLRCTFLGNVGVIGGAITCSDASPAIVDCLFSGNRAIYIPVLNENPRGGAVAFSASSPVIRGCTFSDNRADRWGGAICCQDGGSPTMLNCVFRRNVSLERAGGVLLTNVNATLAGCRFEGNTATDAGGGGMYSGPGGQATLVNCSFVGNVAAHSNGAGLVLFQNTASLTNCIVVGNSAPLSSNGAAGIATAPGSFLLSNSIFAYNSAPGTSSLQTMNIGSGVPALMNYCSVQGWESNVPGPGGSGLDPLFRRPPSPGPDAVWGTPDDDYGDLRLTNGSPAIDSGDSTAVPLDTYDIDADGNTTESLPIDLDGAARFFDAPAVANTGVGTPPVDRGPYEYVPPDTSTPGDRRWVAAAGGVFQTDFNWFPGTPGAADNAVFDLPGTYGVTFPAGQPINNLRARILRGSVTFNLGASPYNLTSNAGRGLVVGESGPQPASLAVAGGRVNAASAIIGDFPGSSGQVSVAGAGSILAVLPANLVAGYEGQATLDIAAGGRLITRNTFIGFLASSEADVRITGPGSRWDNQIVIFLDNGSLHVADGGVVASGGPIFVLPSGRITGDGTINADVSNIGSIDPGDGARAATGTLTINGNYEQTADDPLFGPESGSLRMRVDALTPGQYDKLIINGSATLAGGLIISGPADLPLAPGQTLTLIDPLDRVGQFNVAFLPARLLEDGTFYKVSYGSLRGPGSGVNIGIAPLPGNPNFNNPNQNIVSGSPTGVATGDLNGDGLPDLAVTVPDTANPTGNPGSVVVLFNGGIGPGGWNGFSSSAQINLSFNAGADQSRQPAGVAIADLDGVTGNDLAIVGASSNNLLLLKNNGSGSFVLGAAIPTGNEPRAVAAASFDGINGRDVAVANADDDTLVVYLNNGGGNFGFVSVPPRPTGRRPVSIDPFDSDGDKDLDISIANFGQGGVSGGSISVIRNTGPGGTFQPAATVDLPAGAGTSQVTTGDLNGDSRVDLVATNTDGGTVSVIVNTGNVSGAPTFAPQVELPVGSGPTSLTRVDLDQDNDLDVAVLATTQNGPRVNVLRNDTNGGTQLQFAAASELAAGPQPLFVVNADVDANGRQDLVAVNAGNLRGVDPEAGVFTLRNNATIPCPADWDRNGQVQSADIASFVSDWFASVQLNTLRGDFDRNNQVQPADIGAFVSTWFAALTGGGSGCTP